VNRQRWNRARAILLVLGGVVALLGRPGQARAEALQASGLVIPSRQVDVVAGSDGIVTAVLVKEGDVVAEGQVVARLDARREQLEADYARLVMEKRQADLAAVAMLFKENIVSKEQEQERQVEAKLAETQYQIAQQRLESKAIKAPFRGLVVRSFRERGESIRALERVITLANLDTVYVTLYFESAQLLRVHTNQQAQVTIPLAGAQPFAGTVETVDPVVDPASGTFRVKVVVDNSEHRIRTGVKAEVRLDEATHDAGGR
jgi:membrane fusion protein, multidrug efflux system